MPKVVNLRDTKGKVPEGAALVDRRTKWGNPFRVPDWDREEAILLYRKLIAGHLPRMYQNYLPWHWRVRLSNGTLEEKARQELRGKDLACWCAPLPCHADVLLKTANREEEGGWRDTPRRCSRADSRLLGRDGGVPDMTDTARHSDLVALAARWLEKEHVVVCTEITTWATRESPDALGWRSDGSSTLVECKASRSDFLADKRKRFRQEPEKGMGVARYYLAPKGVIAPEEMPEGWGLLVPYGRGCMRQFHARGFEAVNVQAEMSVLISCLRRVGNKAEKTVSVRLYKYQTGNTQSLGIDLGEQIPADMLVD